MKIIPILILLFCCISAFAQNGWIIQSSGTTVNLHSVNFDHSTSNRAWACGDSGTVLFTSNAGLNWIRQVTGTTNDLYGIAYKEDNGSVIAVGEGGTVLRTTNQGTTWVNIPTPTTRTLRDISDWRFYAVGDSGTIIHSTDGGLNWANRISNTVNDLYSVIGLEPTPTAVGINGTIVRSDLNGVNWSTINSGTAANLYGVPLVPLNIIAGAGGTLLKSTNNGNNWFALTSGVTFDLNFIGDASGAIYIAGDGGKILKSTNNGNNWFVQNTPTSNDLNSVFFYLFVNTGYAVGNSGTIMYTTTGGITALQQISGEVPTDYRLYQNYPNPFNPGTTIKFDIPRSLSSRRTTLRIHNISGELVTELVNADLAAGRYEVNWNASESASGIYFYSLSSGSYILTGKMILTK